MANICTNILYLSTKSAELRDTVKKSIVESLPCYSADTSDREVFDCSIEFESRWIFPHSEMEKITEELPKENDLYIRVLSHEFGCDYVGYNVYSQGEWTDKFAN